jgi:hypothetical protein
VRKLIILFFVLACAPLFSQAFRIEFGYSLLSYTQTGRLYAQHPGHVPSWYESAKVDRKLRSHGFTASVFYPLNFGTRSYEVLSFGPQLGIALNKSSMEFSQDAAYKKITGMNVRVPLLFSVRIGSLHTAYRHVLGIALASGIEMMQMRIADQTGTFYLPVVQVSFALSRFSFNVNSYPMSIESVYMMSGKEVPRLTTRFIEFQVLIAFDCYPGRYHNDSSRRKASKR